MVVFLLADATKESMSALPLDLTVVRKPIFLVEGLMAFDFDNFRVIPIVVKD